MTEIRFKFRWCFGRVEDTKRTFRNQLTFSAQSRDLTTFFLSQSEILFEIKPPLKDLTRSNMM